MKGDYQEDEFLMLSGVQHMAFCERQWALIHIEQQWQENRLTVEGRHLHEHADDPFENDTRQGLRVTRGVQIESRRLGLRGVADVVEYAREDDLPADESVKLKGRSGRWKVIPVEYKRGKPKLDDIDKVQLCAQAICLEEMFGVKIKEGYLYYNSTRRRQKVEIDLALRKKVEFLSSRMHRMMTEGFVPVPIKKSHCLSCSLYETCQPDWRISNGSVAKYLENDLYQIGDTDPS